MQYTIEARELSSDAVRRPVKAESRTTVVEARDADEALSLFVNGDEFELVSFVQPRGRESIATIKKHDAVYLVRVYAN